MSKCYICGKDLNLKHVYPDEISPIICRECALGIAEGKRLIIHGRRCGKNALNLKIMQDVAYYTLTKEQVEVLFEEYLKGEKDESADN